MKEGITLWNIEFLKWSNFPELPTPFSPVPSNLSVRRGDTLNFQENGQRHLHKHRKFSAVLGTTSAVQKDRQQVRSTLYGQTQAFQLNLCDKYLSTPSQSAPEVGIQENERRHEGQHQVAEKMLTLADPLMLMSKNTTGFSLMVSV